MNQWTVRVRNENWERLSTRDMMRAAHQYLEEDCGLVVVEYKGSPESGIYRFVVKGNEPTPNQIREAWAGAWSGPID